MSVDFDSFYTKKGKKEKTEENKLLEENAKLTLEAKKLREQCKLLDQKIKEFLALEFHCGKCSKPLTLEYMRQRSDENRIICSDCKKIRDNDRKTG